MNPPPPTVSPSFRNKSCLKRLNSPHSPHHSFTSSPGEKTFEVKIVSAVEPLTRIWIQVLDRQDGSFLVRYRMYATYTNVHIHILLKNKHVAKSPFFLKGRTWSQKQKRNVSGRDFCSSPFTQINGSRVNTVEKDGPVFLSVCRSSLPRGLWLSPD